LKPTDGGKSLLLCIGQAYTVTKSASSELN
jgi:hypothetical protein